MTDSRDKFTSAFASLVQWLGRWIVDPEVGVQFSDEALLSSGRDQIAALVLVSPESGKHMVISSELKCGDDGFYIFQVSTWLFLGQEIQGCPVQQKGGRDGFASVYGVTFE